MNRKYRMGLLLAFITLAAVATTRAQVSEDLGRADKQFDLYAYNLALRSYENVLKSEPRNSHALARTGDCYFQLNRPAESLEWYEKAVQSPDVKADVLRRYAVALMHTGDYVGAKKWFRLFAEGNQKVGQHYADMCEYAIQAARREPLYLTKNEPLSTEAADYSPTFLGSKIVYSSSRTDMPRKTSSKTGMDYTGSAFNQLYLTQRNPETGYLQKPSFLRSDLQNNYNEGPVSFSADGRRVAFCRNNFIDGTRQIAEKGINLSLYVADVSEDGNWSNVRAFPYNGSDYSTGFPCLSANGSTLLYASNDPAGYGGWDIYVTNLTSTGWSTPRNLGPAVNTPGNEITPYYDGKSLYFSSDWLMGLGGMDVFKAELGDENVKEVYHLGPGINSSRDDYGFVFDESQNIGYLTSNRTGGRGNEDIWQVTMRVAPSTVATQTASNEVVRPSEYSTPTTTTPKERTATTGFGQMFIQVADEYGNPIPDAELDAMDCGVGYGRTDKNGKYYFDQLDRLLDCKILVRKDGYTDGTINQQSFGRQNVTLALNRDRRQEYMGTVRDIKSKQPINGVDVQLQLISGRIIQTQTDLQGNYSLFLERDETYFVTYSKYGYIDEIIKTTTGQTAILNTVLLTRKGTETAATTPTSNNDLTLVQHSTTGNPTPTKLIASADQPAQPQGVFMGYSIQLAASPTPLPDSKIRQFEDYTKSGNIYEKEEGGNRKFRLGIYPDKAEAEKQLKVVKKKHKDAFIVPEYDQDQSLVVGGNAVNRPAQYSTTTDMAAKGDAPTLYYAVQVASLDAGRAFAINEFTPLGSIGNLYSKNENGQNKVRVGVWTKHADAEAAQTDAVARGFKDATIVTEKAEDASLTRFVQTTYYNPAAAEQPVQHSTVTPEEQKTRGGQTPKAGNFLTPTEYSTTSNPKPEYKKPAGIYFVRLTTLSNPSGFNTELLDGIGGTFETRPASNGMTIMLLSGFEDIQSASQAQKRAEDKGFTESFVAKEDKATGKFIRVQ